MQVILYHQEGCGMCKAIEMQLKKNNISYESCTDVDEMKTKGINHTPILEVDGEQLVGKDILDWIRGR